MDEYSPAVATQQKHSRIKKEHKNSKTRAEKMQQSLRGMIAVRVMCQSDDILKSGDGTRKGVLLCWRRSNL